jgi:hypothetical protein
MPAAVGMEHAHPVQYPVHLARQSSSLAMLELEPVADGDWQVRMQSELHVSLTLP